MRLKSVKKQGQNVNGVKHETTGFRITHKNKRRATTWKVQEHMCGSAALQPLTNAPAINRDFIVLPLETRLTHPWTLLRALKSTLPFTQSQ